tara:strand:- start:24 stop:449 length:426 start_codon:yes stop_codon:yes gene_type:complete
VIQIIKSLAVLLTVSLFIAGCFYFLNVSFWPVFGLSVISQFILYDLFSRWNNRKAEIEFQLIQNERIKEFNKFGVDAVCPVESCMHTTFVPVDMTRENEFECPKCKAEVKVMIGSKTFLKTTPIDGDPFEKFNFVTNQDYE